MTTTRKRMTLDEFLKLPEEKPALELIDGVVYQKVSPMADHSVLQFAMAELIQQFAFPRRLARVFPELRGTYGEDSLVPDVAVYRWERVARTPEGRVATRPEGVPDIAVEIRSVGQSLTRQIDKCRRLVQSGTQIALLVDPTDETVRRFAPDGTLVTLRGDARVDLDEVLPGFVLTVREVFDSLWHR